MYQMEPHSTDCRVILYKLTHFSEEWILRYIRSYLYLFLMNTRAKVQATLQRFSLFEIGEMSTPHNHSTQVGKIVSLLKLLPILVYLQLFPSKSHITSVFTKRTLNPCLLNISFHSINCSWRFASPSSTTARPPAYNSFLEYDFYINLSAYQFHHSDKQQWGQGAPMC